MASRAPLSAPAAAGHSALGGEIFNLFAAWPAGSQRTQALAAAAQQLDSWDDTLRVAFANNRSLYKRGQITDLGQLVRSIRMYRIDEGVTNILKAISNSPHLQDLTHLSVYRCEEIDPEAFADLAQSSYLRNLQQLEIHRSSLGMNDSFYDFSPSSDLESMRSLKIVPKRVYFFDLMRSPVVANLRWLKLTSLFLKDWYVEVLTQAAFAARLEHLNLNDNGITAAGAQLLANTPAFQNLIYLSLSQNHLGDAGAQHLAQSPHLQKLQELHLVGAGVKQPGRQALQNAPHLRNTKIVFE